MGEAKRRKISGTSLPDITPERQLLAKAAMHFNRQFVIAMGLVGGCYYISLALRHYVGTTLDLNVTSVLGFSRPQRSGYRWSSHMWVEFEGQTTDLAVAMAIPPDFPGQLLIDGRVRKAGAPTFYSKVKPDDGVEIDVDRSDAVGANARKEHSFYSDLVSADLEQIGEYLKTMPIEHQIATAAAWKSFRP